MTYFNDITFMTYLLDFYTMSATTLIDYSIKDNSMRYSFKSGEANPKWQGGISTPNCYDCGKVISKGHKLCKSCARKGANHPNWKGGKSSPLCLDCGKSIYKGSTRCSECSYKFRFPKSEIKKATPTTTIKELSNKLEPKKKAKNLVATDCKNCGKEFLVTAHDAKSRIFCGKSCFFSYRRDNKDEYTNKFSRVTLSCLICKKEFESKKARLENSNPRFCSKECYGKWRSENIKGENHPRYTGQTDETARLRRTKKYIEWTKSVYAKYNWTCQTCGIKCKKGNITAHHIKPFKEYVDLRFDVNNGITLCRKCHKHVHKDVGEDTRFTCKITVS